MRTISLFMFFRTLTKSLLAPLPILYILLIAFFAFSIKGKKRIGKYLIWISVVWFFMISTPFLPKTLLASLENKYPPINIPVSSFAQLYEQGVCVNILVLGSGYETDDRLSYSGQLNASSLGRLVEGIRLSHLIPRSKLVFSGYAGRQKLAQADVLALAAQELGIDSTVIQTIPEPWNTKNEAREYFKRFGTTSKLYLVTDAAHMPRAIMHFKKAGLKPIPAPINFVIKKKLVLSSYTDYFPGSQNIRFMEIVIQEYLGILWAIIGGD